MNTEIKELNIENSRVKISTSDLKEQVYDQIYLTHVSRINSLIILDQRKEMQFRKVNYIHFLISLDKPLKKKISYWRLINDELIHRITDISPQTDFKENLIMVALKEVVFSKNGESDTFKKVLTKLNKFGLMDHQYKCMLVKTHIFESNYLSQDNIAELDKIGSHVKIIHTTDLMHGIYFLLHKREEKTEKII
ncbi:MAG: hypothetical protein IPM77_15430 [Crocinitomicaceae bacterium]|nr:hypothetical protein [Crocinitomicaceae bacterium]